MKGIADRDPARVSAIMPPWDLRTPQMREFLWFCVPALLLGFILRVVMTWQMPYGYMQFDSTDFLYTVSTFFEKHKVVIHSKRTFLVPLLYTVPYLLHLPALILIPLVQHLSGLGVILMSGALVRLWLASWRWVIVPVTLLIAANPAVLWYEHALMSESAYLFFVFALALTATLFTRQPTGRHFVWMLAALFFTPASRPEGRLLLGFGFVLLVLVHWRNWRTLGIRLGWLAALSVVALVLTTTHQAGQLLYATVLPLAPDESKVDPEFGRLVRPLRDQTRLTRQEAPEGLQGLSRRLGDMAEAYLKAKGQRGADGNLLCQKMAMEACVHQPWASLRLAVDKFCLATRFPTSIGYDEPFLSKKLKVGFNRKEELGVLGHGLIGRDGLKNPVDVDAFVREHYHPMKWYRAWDKSWAELTLGADEDEDIVRDTPIPALPIFFWVALAGMLIAMLSPGPLQKFHFAWIMSLAVLWFVVSLTGVSNPRYRYAFEPFCVIYIFVGAMLLGMHILRWAGRRLGRSSRAAEASKGENPPTEQMATLNFQPISAP
ncbi:MAG: hypothetical protein ABJF10_29620 [Chthoniobacter sp.]|uniref:hypothetical protein n=1 Tax=Chthoniobacter sp. TaxID=2510640 RepID=UPI0032ABF197